ncbi:hypothetical protein P12x_003412 [Tundrisphaera lichenicola]|uniref:hypothetical protein n=1 Tax=Tundrisphaera lichenicola TaxID=2029860 RepID=UPI003EBAE32E
MNPGNLASRIIGYLLSALAVVLASSCDVPSGPVTGSDLPDAKAARQAIERALQAWEASPDIERTTTTIRPIMFVEQRQPAGQQLRKFVILGESPGYKGYRRFQVKLFLKEPDETIVVSYLIFGNGPIWVYRAEDFDMIMHMDMSMMSTPPGAEVGASSRPLARQPSSPPGPSEAAKSP